FAEPLRELADHPSEGMAAEIAGSDEDRGPKPGRDEIQNEEAAPMDPADAEREGRKDAHAVNEAEGQDEPGVIAIEPTERAIDARLPSGLARQKLRAEMAADPEIGLIAVKAPEPRGDQEQRPSEQSLRGGEAGKNDEGFALEECPGEGHEIGQRP